MSRTIKGAKGPGYDYGARRPGNSSYCNSPGKGVKAATHRAERRNTKWNQRLAEELVQSYAPCEPDRS